MTDSHICSVQRVHAIVEVDLSCNCGVQHREAMIKFFNVATARHNTNIYAAW